MKRATGARDDPAAADGSDLRSEVSIGLAQAREGRFSPRSVAEIAEDVMRGSGRSGMADTITFDDSGIRFRIEARGTGGAYDVTTTIRPDGPITRTAPDWEGVCALVDAYVDLRPPEDRAFGFRGLEIERRRHDGGAVETWSLPTRGAAMRHTGDGSVPILDDIAEAVRADGDVLLAVRDGDGRMLLDLREDAARQVVRDDGLTEE